MVRDDDGGDAALVTVVVPAFNEAARLADRAQRFKAAVADGVLDPHRTELIVVDDGSTDDTGAAAAELLGNTFERLRILRQDENAGKGAAIRRGIKEATAPFVLFMDADMSVDPLEIQPLVDAIETADVAIGSRELPDSVVEVDSLRRRVMGRTFNTLVSTLTDLPYRDTQCGFKAFRTPLARLLFHFMRVQRFAFDVEVLCLARRLQMDVVEVPVRWREMRRSSVRMIADPLSMARDVVRVRMVREWPSVPALSIRGTQGEPVPDGQRVLTHVGAGIGSRYPSLLTHECDPLILLPLCEPDEVQAVAREIEGAGDQFSVRECTVDLGLIAEAAPFRWITCRNEDALGAVPRAGGPVAQVPVAGWRATLSSSAESTGRIGRR